MPKDLYPTENLTISEPCTPEREDAALLAWRPSADHWRTTCAPVQYTTNKTPVL